jgi:indole-3-acetaldehyde oxidase
MYLDRKTDMIMMGGRHPVKAVFSVGFKHDGKVTGLRAQVDIDGGWSEDCSPTMPMTIASGLKKYDWGSMDVNFHVCRTNMASKSAMRAPGHVQGSFIADTVMEHIAAVLGIDVHDVITKNMHTPESLHLLYRGTNFAAGREEPFTLPSLWTTMLERIEPKVNEVRRFNNINTWRKRGLSAIHCVYDVLLVPRPARVSIFHDGSVVVEVGGVEIGQGLWTKVKQATVYGLSSLLPLDGSSVSLNVRVVQADSISLPHGGITSGSTTSEGSCEAVRQACQCLVDRLMPLKIQREQQASCTSLSWCDLIQQVTIFWC